MIIAQSMYSKNINLAQLKASQLAGFNSENHCCTLQL